MEDIEALLYIASKYNANWLKKKVLRMNYLEKERRLLCTPEAYLQTEYLSHLCLEGHTLIEMHGQDL